jgi:hypothetical protein
MDPIPEPEKRPLHGYKYTPKEQSEKDSTIKQMMRDWPDTPGGELWCEYVYDFCKQTPQDEIDRIIQAGEWDRPSKFSPSSNKKLIDGSGRVKP